jgi:hypothetical protein
VNKLKINGTHVTYCVVEFGSKEALYLQNIMEKELINYDEIFFKLKAFKKLGYKTLEELPIISQVSGFIPDRKDVFQYQIDDKTIFKSPMNTLENKYFPNNLWDEKTINPIITSVGVDFIKRRTCKYFLLNIIKKGTFKTILPSDFQLLDLLIIHQNCYFKRFNKKTEHLIQFKLGDRNLQFTLGTHSDITKSISVIKGN